MADRNLWTDERIDDLVAHLYARFDQLDARFEAMDRRFERLEQRQDRLLEEMTATQRQIATFGWGIVGTIVVQTTVAVIAALIAFA